MAANTKPIRAYKRRISWSLGTYDVTTRIRLVAEQESASAIDVGDTCAGYSRIRAGSTRFAVKARRVLNEAIRPLPLAVAHGPSPCLARFTPRSAVK